MKKDLLEIYINPFSESVISEIQKLRELCFFSSCSKFNLALKHPAKYSENFSVSEIIASELVSLNCLY